MDDRHGKVEHADMVAIARVVDIAAALGPGPVTRELLSKHPWGVGLVYATYELESSLWLGGLGHYVYYYQADLIDFAIEAYEEFNSPLHAAWTRRAREHLVIELGSLWDTRASAFDEVVEAARRFDDEPWLADLNRDFFDVEKAENSWLLRDAVLLANPARYAPIT